MAVVSSRCVVESLQARHVTLSDQFSSFRKESINFVERSVKFSKGEFPYISPEIFTQQCKNDLQTLSLKISNIYREVLQLQKDANAVNLNNFRYNEYLNNIKQNCELLKNELEVDFTAMIAQRCMHSIRNYLRASPEVILNSFISGLR